MLSASTQQLSKVWSKDPCQPCCLVSHEMKMPGFVCKAEPQYNHLKVFKGFTKAQRTTSQLSYFWTVELSFECLWFYLLTILLMSWLIFKGLLERQAFQEADEDVVTDVDFTNMISEEEREELKTELVKVVCCIIVKGVWRKYCVYGFIVADHFSRITTICVKCCSDKAERVHLAIRPIIWQILSHGWTWLWPTGFPSYIQVSHNDMEPFSRCLGLLWQHAG